MKQLALQQPESRKAIVMILMVFVAAVLSSTGSPASTLASSDAGGLEPKTTVQEPKPTDVRDITLAVPIQRELAGGQAHSYRVVLEAGQYLRVVVEQKGIDVVVRLFGPDGQKITEVDNPNGTTGPEPVSLIAQTSGDYRFEVSSPEKVAPGRYEITIEDLRESTAKDRDRVAAERISVVAEQLRGQGTADSLRKTMEKYNEALPLWRAAGDREGEALALNRIGVIYWYLGETQKALEYYGQALPLWHALGKRREEASVLNNIANSYLQLGNNRKSLEYYDQSLSLKRAVGDHRGAGAALAGMGLAYNHLGRLQEAIEHYNQALVSFRAVASREDEAITIINIGGTYQNMGDLQRALEYYGQALSLARAVANPRLQGVALSNIGTVYKASGDLQKALEFYNQALPLRRATGDREGEFTTLHNIGQIYASSGELQKALEYYNQGLSLVRAVGNRRSEAIMFQNIGAVYRLLRDFQKAFEYLNQALLLQREVGDRLNEAITLFQLGTTYSSLAKPKEALSYLEEALSLHRAVGDRISEAATLGNIARAERDRGRLDEARAHIEAALKIIEGTRSKLVSQQLRTSFSASRQDFYELYIDLLMRMHRSQPSAGYDALALQASERSRARSLLDILIEARADIRQGVDPMLLDRERSLQQQLNAKSEQLTRLLSGKHKEEQATAARKDVENLLTDYQEVEAQIRAKSPRYAALTQPQPLLLKEIQQVLDKDTLLLEYALGEERSYVWAVTPTSVTSYELPKRADLETAATRVYGALTARNRLIRFEKQEHRQVRVAQADAEYLETSAVLSQMLLGPVAGRFEGKRLLFVSDGALQYLPFAALPIPGGQLSGNKSLRDRQTGNYQPLIAKHEVLSLPSASTLALLRKELVGSPRGAKTIAVLADPVFQGDDPRVRRDSTKTDKKASVPSSNSVKTEWLESEMVRSARDTGEVEFRRLPFSRQEAEAIAALTPRAMRKESLDFQANRATATSADLSNYRIIHFATHGLLDSKHPELSGIVLSLVNNVGEPEDGFLRLNEIYNLKLGADLVVLSACRTALGKEIRGEGLVGLTRGFMYAGAPRVVASLWAVDDRMTAELMKRFYREMLIKKQRPAAALRAAQVGIWQSKRLPPYYWAAFVLQGEWK